MICKKCGNEIPPDKVVTIEDYEDWCHPCYKAEPRRICVDFDGVIAQYTGWKGPDHIGAPIPGVEIFLSHLRDRYRVVVHSTRNIEDIYRWLCFHGLEGFVYLITNKKVPAEVYIDDRAMCFRGSFTEIMARLQNFKPYWKEGK
jgi:hypothetical protein